MKSNTKKITKIGAVIALLTTGSVGERLSDGILTDIRECLTNPHLFRSKCYLQPDMKVNVIKAVTLVTDEHPGFRQMFKEAVLNHVHDVQFVNLVNLLDGLYNRHLVEYGTLRKIIEDDDEKKLTGDDIEQSYEYLLSKFRSGKPEAVRMITEAMEAARLLPDQQGGPVPPGAKDLEDLREMGREIDELTSTTETLDKCEGAERTRLEYLSKVNVIRGAWSGSDSTAISIQELSRIVAGKLEELEKRIRDIVSLELDAISGQLNRASVDEMTVQFLTALKRKVDRIGTMKIESVVREVENVKASINSGFRLNTVYQMLRGNGKTRTRLSLDSSSNSLVPDNHVNEARKSVTALKFAKTRAENLASEAVALDSERSITTAWNKILDIEREFNDIKSSLQPAPDGKEYPFITESKNKIDSSKEKLRAKLVDAARQSLSEIDNFIKTKSLSEFTEAKISKMRKVLDGIRDLGLVDMTADVDRISPKFHFAERILRINQELTTPTALQGLDLATLRKHREGVTVQFSDEEIQARTELLAKLSDAISEREQDDLFADEKRHLEGISKTVKNLVAGTTTLADSDRKMKQIKGLMKGKTQVESQIKRKHGGSIPHKLLPIIESIEQGALIFAKSAVQLHVDALKSASIDQLGELTEHLSQDLILLRALSLPDLAGDITRMESLVAHSEQLVAIYSNLATTQTLQEINANIGTISSITDAELGKSKQELQERLNVKRTELLRISEARIAQAKSIVDSFNDVISYASKLADIQHLLGQETDSVQQEKYNDIFKSLEVQRALKSLEDLSERIGHTLVQTKDISHTSNTLILIEEFKKSMGQIMTDLTANITGAIPDSVVQQQGAIEAQLKALHQKLVGIAQAKLLRISQPVLSGFIPLKDYDVLESDLAQIELLVGPETADLGTKIQRIREAMTEKREAAKSTSVWSRVGSALGGASSFISGMMAHIRPQDPNA